MNIHYSLKTAIRGLTTNKSRSALTILGIVIGITAIIIIVSIGKGAQNLILDQIQGMGSNTIAVAPGRHPKGLADAAQILSDSLREKDFDALSIKSNVPTMKRVVPLVFGGETASYQNEAYRVTVFGTSEAISEILDLYPSEGRFITDDDAKSLANVAIIGSKVKEELFGSSEALGQKIKIKNKNFRVIGVFPKKGQITFFNFDEATVIPYTTAQKYIFGIQYFHRFIVEANSVANINKTKQDIATTLRNSHGITNPDKDDFFTETQADISQRLGIITDILTLFLASVAAISLLVGGIGIMNIMLVSVTERTREIGLRKAIGATENNILTQFLFESITLTGIGGIIGITFGALFSFLISLILSNVVGLSWDFAFPVSAALLGIAVSAIVGLIFGLYPARKASQKSPIEALRYE